MRMISKSSHVLEPATAMVTVGNGILGLSLLYGLFPWTAVQFYPRSSSTRRSCIIDTIRMTWMLEPLANCRIVAILDVHQPNMRLRLTVPVSAR